MFSPFASFSLPTGPSIGVFHLLHVGFLWQLHASLHAILHTLARKFMQVACRCNAIAHLRKSMQPARNLHVLAPSCTMASLDTNTAKNPCSVCSHRLGLRLRTASLTLSLVICVSCYIVVWLCPAVRRRLRRYLLRRGPLPARHLCRPLQGPQHLRALCPRQRHRGKIIRTFWKMACVVIARVFYLIKVVYSGLETTSVVLSIKRLLMARACTFVRRLLMGKACGISSIIMMCVYSVPYGSLPVCSSETFPTPPARTMLLRYDAMLP